MSIGERGLAGADELLQCPLGTLHGRPRRIQDLPAALGHFEPVRAAIVVVRDAPDHPTVDERLHPLAQRRRPQARLALELGRRQRAVHRHVPEQDLGRTLQPEPLDLPRDELVDQLPGDVELEEDARAHALHVRDHRTHVDVLRLATLLEELPTERTRLLDNLGRIRREVGPITPELADALADRMNLRRGDVHEVVSFYSFLQVPVDAVRVCTGPVCDWAGARELLAESAIEVPCLGHCDLAPVVLHGDDVLGGVTYSTNNGRSLELAGRDETLADYERRGGLALLREPLEP